MKKLAAGIFTAAATILALPAIAFAHVIVTPSQADVGQELVFNVSVPNERNSAVTSVKLDIPKGVDDVTPTVIPGWHIATATSGSKDSVTAITWTGNIPVGQREDFSFGAQVPASATQLDWKAYQTYADGTIVHWDQRPTGNDDASGDTGPYSVTKVVNDLDKQPSNNDNKTTMAFVLSTAALALSIGGLFLRRRGR